MKPKDLAEKIAQIVAKEAGASVNLDWIDIAIVGHPRFTRGELIAIREKVDAVLWEEIRNAD